MLPLPTRRPSGCCCDGPGGAGASCTLPGPVPG
jgi:hypothetical protein